MNRPIPDRSTPFSRARLSFRVASEINQLPEHFTVVADPETQSSPFGSELPGSDFLVQQLDLRVRLYLVDEAGDAEDLVTKGNVEVAQKILNQWPETSAVALVANDEALSAVVIEPYERDRTVQAPSGARGAVDGNLVPAPLLTAITSYFAVNSLEWSDVPRLIDDADVQLDVMTREAAVRALDSVAQRHVQIEEKRKALDSLGPADADLVARWLSDILSGAASVSDILRQLDRGAHD